MATPARKAIGRRRSTKEKKSERLPPIYVTPTFKGEIEQRQAFLGLDWSEFGRNALEMYVDADDIAVGDQHTPAEAAKPDNVVTIELEPEHYEKLAALAEDLGMPKVEYLLMHLARRALKVKPRELHSFLYGDFFDGEDEAVEEDRKRQQEKRSGRASGKAA